MQRFAKFLEWKPSQIAAVAIILSVNLNQSPVAPQVGLRTLKGDKVRSLMQRSSHNDLISELTGVLESSDTEFFHISNEPKEPAFLNWTNRVSELTKITTTEIRAPYMALLNHLDTYQFKNKLQQD